MPMAEKLHRGFLTAIKKPHSTRQGLLFYVKNRSGSQNFLVDTGAEVSALPASNQDRRRTPIMYLTAVNGSRIAVYYRSSLPLDFGLRRIFHCVFLVADTTRCMLGSDFLAHNILVDVARCMLLDNLTGLFVKSVSKCIPTAGVTEPRPQDTTSEELLPEFPSLTAPCDWTKPVKHPVLHRIPTRGQPVFAKARCLSPEKLAIARQEFVHMLALGTVRLSSSTWSAPPPPKKILENIAP
ncbi:uncharacterized protein LOC135373853 [Ornithodoros turicata]|uniref:uncharacterized protein LOC135373853 n=1 Tax=Ornithodoros turicata TaxID=34597 RepID=UPI003138C1C8